MTTHQQFAARTGHVVTTADPLWTVERSASPIIGTAIHNGHHTRPDLTPHYALPEDGRLREEDPFTEYFIRDLPNRVIFHRSRFEIDLNRARDAAVYLRPDQAWGLNVWHDTLPQAQVDASLAIHDAYYAMLEQTLAGLEAMHGGFILLDIHSYNHRRDGADATPTDPEKAPVINIGTFSMDRDRWAPLLDPFLEALAAQSVDGAPIDVRENVAFEGRGEQTRFVHERFPKTGCAIAIEFKKVFMDEWTGEPSLSHLDQFRAAITATLPVLSEKLKAVT
ncbi:N-formylglutamate amidohydrolase [Pelagibacterium luteolum]|uniref:N-formylglutamate amidohydrolase n=1 Tax=Pelagibacterium luteolum TaxID=440168 RepID=A0A1G7TD36_9HYPH|nr:N-formylglutamate amidohydrolase [Pelagibacterium luteolum]SDG33111.1 N-formylglutamate amidohydrolase [Pelagibacterium luteolum]